MGVKKESTDVVKAKNKKNDQKEDTGVKKESTDVVKTETKQKEVVNMETKWKKKSLKYKVPLVLRGFIK